MRVIDAFDESVQAVAVSPDGRFLAAATHGHITVFDWYTGARLGDLSAPRLGQMVFGSSGTLVYRVESGLACFVPQVDRGVKPRVLAAGHFSGGVAVSPDGKTVAATRSGYRQQVPLERWEFPSWRSATGFTYWSPFRRLGFSPSGEYLAGIDADTFELRIAVSGGQNGRRRVPYVGDGFFAFARDSQSVVFGWETDLHVMETQNGQVQRRVTSPGDPFTDVAFLGSGRQLATVDDTPVLRVWSAESWEVMRGYDWNAGGLTCVTATADGLAGVCGTDSGKLVVFDVDE
jgi:WD40 repeat protein